MRSSDMPPAIRLLSIRLSYAHRGRAYVGVYICRARQRGTACFTCAMRDAMSRAIYVFKDEFSCARSVLMRALCHYATLSADISLYAVT